MAFDFKYPSITAPNTDGKITQIQNYLRTLSDQLNWSFNNVTEIARGINSAGESTNQSGLDADIVKSFETLKTLIISSADIISYFESKLKMSFDSVYASKNDFEDYCEQTDSRLNNLYPVGSIYLSTTNQNPAGIFGGTWERIKDCLLMCSGDDHEAGTTGTIGGGNSTTYLSVYAWKRIN